MNENARRIVAARPTDMEPSISVMVRAFASDPVARWMYREPQRYLVRSVRPRVRRHGSMFAEMTAYHPHHPHWYLATIGVEPYLQGKGFGSRLLTETLKRCDRERMPAYLESSNPANAALYQRFGFEGLGVIRVGHSPPMVPMLRSAR